MTIARTRTLAATLPRPRAGNPQDDDDTAPTRVYVRDERTSDVVRVAPRDLRWPMPSSDRNALLPASPVERSRAIIAAIVDELPPLATIDTSRPRARLDASRSLAAFDASRLVARERTSHVARRPYIDPRAGSALEQVRFGRHLPGGRPATAHGTYARPNVRPNVFLMPPRVTDPAPPWARIRGAASPPALALRRTRRRSFLPLLVALMALGIGIGLWRDENARASVVSELARTAARVSAFVVEMAIR
jgi:hypothetical protein